MSLTPTLPITNARTLHSDHNQPQPSYCVHNHAQCQCRKCTTNHFHRQLRHCVAKIVKTSLLPWDRREQIPLDSWWLPSWFPRRTRREAMSGFWPVELGPISPEEVRWGSSTGAKTGRLLATCCASTVHLISDVGRSVRLVLRLVFPLISSAHYRLVSGVEPPPLRPIRNLFRALYTRTANSSC